ncbi:universal stress protein [Curtobacterium sp. A7_M15]|uniref:universal stress protein n=1 Tax=Curtobacterium sp. A7_M15 TaxID=3065241 RepID=UPI002737D007|nr:universal stress protein [Curtobacterium sp. A7_M15]MDP4335120.1 universal stress protein [Curtobacterium sp. A7_M15]
MTTTDLGRIVVGFDGSEPATAALDRTLTLGERLGVPVEVVTSWRWPITWSTLPVANSWSPLHDAEEIRQHAAEVLERHGPVTVDVTTRTVEGGATEALVDASQDAGLLVVGSRGRGGFRGLLLGSVSAACIQHASCPVLVDRGAATASAGRGTVVVGVDGSPESGHALRFAVTLARGLGLRVRTITTWQWPEALNREEPPFDHWSPEQDALSTASSALDAAEDLIDDDVEVTSELVEGRPAGVLLDASRDAALLVLGNRGLGGFRGLLVGSVTQECAQHASCPVVVHRP